MCMTDRPFVLSIAGMDPSAGAGILGDIKTLESLGCYGFAVNTANTIQNDITFETCYWTPEEVILQQLELIINRFEIKVVKIGIIETLQVLERVIERVLLKNNDSKIIWDPVLRSSTGFSFHDRHFAGTLDSVLESVFMVTPNFDELSAFYPDHSMEERISKISSKTNLYLKGGHRPQQPGLDELFTTEGDYREFKPGRTDCFEKHGSGCMLSSAIAAFLAQDHSLVGTCKKAKDYIEKILASNKTLLAYHYL